MNNEYIVIVTAITFMIGTAIFYENRIAKVKNPHTVSQANYYTIENIPGTFVTIGLLGTCIGIALGLFNFNTDPSLIKESVKELLSGLKLAFIITILGLVFSLYYKERVNNLLNQYPELQPPASPELIEMIKVNENLIKLDAGISNLNRAFSDDLISKIQESNKKLADNLSKFGENLATSNHDALIEALEEVITDLNDSFKDTLGLLVKQNFSELTNSIDSLNHWQKENKAYIENFAQRYETIVNHTESINTNLENIVNTNANLLSQNSKLYDIIDALNSVMVDDTRFTEITTNLNDSSSNIKDAVSELQSDLVEIKNNLTAIANLRTNIEFLNNQLAALKQIDTDEERMYVKGIESTMASMDEMFKKHYEAIPKLIDMNIKQIQNGKNSN